MGSREKNGEKVKHGSRNMSNIGLDKEELLQLELMFNATPKVLLLHYAKNYSQQLTYFYLILEKHQIEKQKWITVSLRS